MLPPTLRAFALCAGMGMLAALPAAPLRAADVPPTNGLALTISAGDRSHQLRAANVGLYVSAGEAANPFVAPGAFAAVWTGILHAELRGSVSFQVEFAGSCQLEINGQPVLSAISTNAQPAVAQTGPVALSKGANRLIAKFQSARTGDSFLRLGWAERGTNFSPIPASALSLPTSATLARDQELAEARALFFEHRCVACHREVSGDPSTRAPELTMDAPAFAGLGGRRHAAWLRDWILDPRARRPSARMPKLLSGPDAQAEAGAIAAYLRSLTNSRPAWAPAPYQTRSDANRATSGPTAAAREARPLYDRLQCGACHNPPGTPATAADPQKLSHDDLRAKFPPGQLAQFLLAPEADQAWTRMPNFHLSAEEARALEDYLLAGASGPPGGAPAAAAGPSAKPEPNAELIAQGQRLVQAKGCRQCHEPSANEPRLAPSLAELGGPRASAKGEPTAEGCLGATPRVDFGFSPAQKAMLQRLLREAPDAIRRHVPSEFAERQSRTLACAACHGPSEPIPPWDLLGTKLKPEWSARFMAGEIRHKMRYDQHPSGEPWLEARMPAFRSRAGALAAGLAALHGFPPRTPAEPTADAVAARHGRTLVGKNGGFSCVSCHAVGAMPALEVFESEGINLAYSADRLRPSYYRRWFRNPLSIDPQTKMPVYFDEEGGSPLTDVLNGDGAAQIDAVWHYLRLCEQLPQPE